MQNLRSGAKYWHVGAHALAKAAIYCFLARAHLDCVAGDGQDDEAGGARGTLRSHSAVYVGIYFLGGSTECGGLDRIGFSRSRRLILITRDGAGGLKASIKPSGHLH